MEPRHDTVLLEEAVHELQVRPTDVVVDATLGAAGHFAKLAGSLGPLGTLIGIDADAASLARAELTRRALTVQAPKVHLVHDNFRNLGRILDDLEVSCIDKALFDLGWNGFQLSAGRGFSFRADEPLHMTYGDPAVSTTAEDLVNELSEEELADLIYNFGEERFSRGIARAIVEMRRKNRVRTTVQLVAAIEAGTPSWYHHRRLHPATKTFQALRIATNDELGALRDGLTAALDRLTLGGRIAVITFHSIEDRIVKSLMKDAAYAGKGSVATRKPIVPSERELTANPRARSAKLRVFERCTGEGVCITKPESVALYV